MAHSAVISWNAPSDATSSSTYNVYRAVGTCPSSGLGTLSFSKLNTSPITTLSFTDSTIVVGTAYCYYGTQVQGSAESVPSNTAGGVVRPNAVTINLVLS